ncbi:MAG TPA: TIR domain-containing protein [Opitutaceae bacterium]
MPQRPVFLSYAREDSPSAQRIADALRSHGIEAWFDQSELRGGDAWDQKIRRQIKECALFLPVISARTQARGEGYFRLEWKLAVERTHLMAEGVPFLAPVVVDDTPEGAALVPAEFLRVQWIRLPGSLPTPQFVAQVKRMLEPPATGRGSAPPQAAPGRPADPVRPRRRGLMVGAVIAGCAAAAAAAYFRAAKHGGAQPVPAASAPAAASQPTVDPKSVAVLPFENMSEDKDNAFFADGVHEDILTHLALVKELHVVSRTSVMQYRGTTKPIKEIGRELGVAYILEGSVRREGNMVRVTGQLIDARTDEHVWAKAYDRDVSDIFAIQGELAEAIAGALQSVLSPEEKDLVTRRPTENSEAYDLYLKARVLRYSAIDGMGGKSRAILMRAVQLDPNFAQAWGELASRLAFALFSGAGGPGDAKLADEAIANATRLAADDPVVIESIGDYYYYAHHDYARATEEYMKLAELRPNDGAVYSSLGLIQRREGRMDDAIANLRRAVDLDPANQSYLLTLDETLLTTRRFRDLDAMQLRWQASGFDPTVYLTGRAYAAFNETGSDSEAKVVYDLPETGPNPDQVLYMKKIVALGIADAPAYIRFHRRLPSYGGDIQNQPWDQQECYAEALAETGDMQGARTEAAKAAAQLEGIVEKSPDNAFAWADLAVSEALLSDRAKALAAIQEVHAAMPESRDAVFGPVVSLTCMQALMWCGEKDQAISEVARLLKVPYGANVFMISREAPLRDDPRVEAMIADPANRAVLH